MKFRQKLQPIDYAVMFGGPIVFLLIFWIGVRLITGPVPEPSPVKKLREGEIQIGAKMTEVAEKLGRPNQVFELEDGRYRYIYTRTVYEVETKSDSLDEAVVEFTSDGRVQSIRFDRSAPPKSPE
jgi:outer membrane protein assembly factor BamE (lipoprotein component of BamABCDE complex)